MSFKAIAQDRSMQVRDVEDADGEYLGTEIKLNTVWQPTWWITLDEKDELVSVSKIYGQMRKTEREFKKKNKESPYEIICLVDRRAGVKHTMSDSRRRSLRRAGGAKRSRIKSKYHYENVTNRIHGFLLLEDLKKNKNIPESKKVLSLSLICSSYYSNMKGVGSFLMKSATS